MIHLADGRRNESTSTRATTHSRKLARHQTQALRTSALNSRRQSRFPILLMQARQLGIVALRDSVEVPSKRARCSMRMSCQVKRVLLRRWKLLSTHRECQSQCIHTTGLEKVKTRSCTYMYGRLIQRTSDILYLRLWNLRRRNGGRRT